ncbi:hypothetical protein PVNG_05612 [Plasmodium vivax North Korean]|uniref:Fam-l protein n=1 Tax=Plasmodium vivax North Korean TaxID=1035514 RepID=A0A0J9U153_PLAVI|nr:hypothetical protein PVNG_05612 [Plasmodium vivax North Korean]
MVHLGNYNLAKSVNLTVFLKKFTFIFLTWACLTYNHVGLFRKSLENIYKNDKTLDIKFNRLLAKHILQRELEHTRLRENFPNKRLYKNERTVSDDLFTYSRVKRKSLNNIDIYMKNYKDRYMKKKGISKLDCYYENKLFKKFCHICDIAEKMEKNKKSSKRFFFKKYGIVLIIFALIPALGFISPILFGIGKYPGIYGLCTELHFYKNTGAHSENGEAGQCDKLWLYKEDVPIKCISYIPSIFSFITIIIVVSVVFYMLIKIMKYEDIKAGKGKMGIKE